MLNRILPGIIVLACGLFLLYALIPMGLQDPGYVQSNSLAPGDMPKAAALIVIAAAVGMIISGAISGGQELVSLGTIVPLRTVLFIAALIALLILIPLLGMTLSAFLFVAGLLIVNSTFSVWKSLLFALFFATCVQILFIELARIPLPRGLLDFI